MIQSRLAERVAIVTGAAQGIGAEYAKALAANGATVLCADITSVAETVSEIKELKGQAEGVLVDVSSRQSAEEMARSCVRLFGRIDILVNNAGIFTSLSLKPFFEISSDEWDKVMAVNVKGSFECARAVLPAMKKQNYGKIINIASGTVFKGVPMLLHYVSSKGAVVAMTRAMARELGPYGIRVNTLAPGLTSSENLLSNPAWAGDVSKNNIASRAIAREMHPGDLCGTLVYLASTESDFVTGQALVVDGGSVMH